MARTFELNILSPDKTIYEGKVISLIVPAALGYLGVLADHAPLAANLVRGKITVKKSSGDDLVFNLEGKGFLEVLKNNVTILVNGGI